jgi:hypothetical protein
MLGWYGPHAALIADEPATPTMLTPDGAINLSLGTWLSNGFAVTATAVHGVPVTPVAYMVVAGEYDDRQVICVCADEGDAAERAGRYNREHRPSEYDAARIEPIEYVPARAAWLDSGGIGDGRV